MPSPTSPVRLTTGASRSRRRLTAARSGPVPAGARRPPSRLRRPRRSIAIKGFKSFPERTRLVFSPGVSVIVGPNGSGKSNITDAVLWALGEQSPLAVRGQTMQDVIFAGSAGVKSRSSCEVEVVIDNSDGALRSDFAEISISRYIDRSGEGIYRLN